MIIREKQNPIITKEQIKPTAENLVVVGVFNCGAVKYRDEIILLLRVAEAIANQNSEVIQIPIADRKIKNGYSIKEIAKDYHKYDFNDSRFIYKLDGKRQIENLTSISHFRLARSKDGVNFIVDQVPTIFPETVYEEWGIEDPRITHLEGSYYITYTAVSKYGVCVGLIKTDDFIQFQRLGIIFSPENKDTVLFPEQINGKYYAYHRPVPTEIGYPDIWLSSSTDLLHWGEHEHILSVATNDWSQQRIGAGAPPIKTKAGWLNIYHGADNDGKYYLSSFLTSLDDPGRIIKIANKPLLTPTEDYERIGFYPNVVFTCGAIMENDMIDIYYGAADDKIAKASISLDDLLSLHD
ncbi:MAG: glycosidase [Acholeplasmataceae bacterium]|nr:glycosidase [Acholeplasmataceae bacterium]